MLIAVLSVAVLLVELLAVAPTLAVSAFQARAGGLERAVARTDACLRTSGPQHVNSGSETVAAQVADSRPRCTGRSSPSPCPASRATHTCSARLPG